MNDLKIRISELQGIDPDHISLIEVHGSGLILQYDPEVRGDLTVDHDEDEYCYFNASYGHREIYCFIKAKDLNSCN